MQANNSENICMETIHIISEKKLIKSIILKSISICMYLWLNSGF